MRTRWFRLLVWFVFTFSIFLTTRLLLGKGFSQSIAIFEDERLERPENANFHQEIPNGAPVYAAGTYMAGKEAGNRSFCRWYHNLPQALSYPPTKVIWSPEAGEKGPYRILPFIIRESRRTEELPQMTLCTHATADQVYAIVELARRWEGSLSFSVFAPGLDAGLAVALLDRACRCEPAMEKVSVHLIFPSGRPPALNRHINRSQKGDCAASDLQWREIETERKQRDMTYPINVARNIARMQARTEHVLVSDVELLPSEKLASGFLEMLHGRPPKSNVIFVVPVFEIEANEQPPKNKHQLLAAARVGSAVYFHRYVCPHCQRFPGLTRWMLRPDSGKVRPLIITRREVPNHRWEPVFIGTREDPLYTEDMTWEGRQDKMAQMFQMCLQNYRLIILDGAFLVHTPGIKRKPIRSNNKPPANRAQERRNARIYQNVVKRLLKQYPSNRKCRQ